MSEPQQPPAQPYGTPPQSQGHRAPQPPGVHHSAQPYSGSEHSEPQQNAGQSHPGQPHPGQPHPAQSHPGSGGYPSSAPSRASSGTPVGRIALIVALAALLIGLIVTISYPVMIRTLADP